MANASFGVNIIPKNNTVTIGNSDSPWTIVSPSLTGVPTAPTAAAGTHTLQVATTEFVENAKPSVMTGATSSADGTSGLVPAPTTNDTYKFLKGDGTWEATGKPMVILSYGNSTWTDFINAYNNNVIVYCRASSNSNPASGSQTRMAFMAYVNDATNPTNVEFQYYRSMSSHSASQQGDQVFVYKLTSSNGGTWTVTTREADTKIVAGTNLSSSYASGVLTINGNYSNFTGATSENAGSAGLVPAPATNERNKFLKGDGTWGSIDSKADKVQNAVDGNLAALDSNGNLVDSGKRAGDFIPTSAKGSNSGVAELDAYGHVPSTQLPSYVDDVLEYSEKDYTYYSEWVPGNSYNVGDKVKITAQDIGYKCKVANSSTVINDAEWDEMTRFPDSGESDKIYIATDTNKTYRWGGSTYVIVGSDLALGETMVTAYRGDRGAAAYAAAVTNVESSPTSESTNLITSGGVYTALNLKAPKAHPVFTGTISMGRSSGLSFGINSVATGSDVTASGAYSHAEGDTTTASGTASHTEGYSSAASGAYSHAEGFGTTASHKCQHVFGEYNVADSSAAEATANGNYVEIVGNGVNDSSRSNARVLDWNGNERLRGNIYVGCNANSSGGTMLKNNVAVYGTKDLASWNEWVSGTSYAVGAKVKITDSPAVDGYICNTANDDSVFVYSKWDQVTVFPAVGDTDMLYVDEANKELYYWDGTQYVSVGGGKGGNSGLITVTGTITNIAGSYATNIIDDRVASTMKPLLIEVSNPTAFNDDINVTCNNGYVTVSCNSVAGSSDISISMMGSMLNSSEFDALNGRLNNSFVEYAFSEQAIISAVEAVEGCTGCVVRVNHSNVSVDGQAAKSIQVFANGGTKANVATAIATANTSGLTTVGTLTQDVDGETIRFSRPTLLAVGFYITITGLTTLDLTTLGATIQTNVSNYVNNLKIGEQLSCGRVRDTVIATIGATGDEYSIDISCSGAHGVERNYLTPAWNEKFTVVSTSNITVTSSVSVINILNTTAKTVVGAIDEHESDIVSINNQLNSLSLGYETVSDWDAFVPQDSSKATKRQGLSTGGTATGVPFNGDNATFYGTVEGYPNYWTQKLTVQYATTTSNRNRQFVRCCLGNGSSPTAWEELASTANMADIEASVALRTTNGKAPRSITTGQYIFWNHELYRTTASISGNGNLTEGTNVVKVKMTNASSPAGALNELSAGIASIRSFTTLFAGQLNDPTAEASALNDVVSNYYFIILHFQTNAEHLYQIIPTDKMPSSSHSIHATIVGNSSSGQITYPPSYNASINIQFPTSGTVKCTMNINNNVNFKISLVNIWGIMKK